MRMCTTLKFTVAGVLAASLLAPAIAASTGSIQGTVVDPGGQPIAAARIEFAAGSSRVAAVSGVDGSFKLDLPAQTYVVTAQARGYAPLASRTIYISEGQTAELVLQLARSTTGSISTLDRVTVNGRQVLSTASAPSASLDPQDLAGRGIENLADALGQQIAVTMTRPA